VVSFGGFPKDWESDKSKIDALVTIKNAMYNGDVLLLVNTAPLNSALYDLLNFHFTSIDGMNVLCFIK
jgi:hypothetical protein